MKRGTYLHAGVRRGADLSLLAALAVCLGAQPLSGQSKTLDPDEASLSSSRPRIPEPMVFDLIRPLGAERGELEVNSLFRVRPTEGPGRLYWAPEIEYAFLDGYGIEFEVPMENAGIGSWKGAIQGTLPRPWERTFIHGWQALGERSRGGDHSTLNLLYLAGARWNHDWSVFTMTGIERDSGPTVAYAPLGNYTLYFHQNETVVYGLESNIKGRGNSGRSLLLMPQVHFRIDRINVQLGAGRRWHTMNRGLEIGWRISREF